MNLVRKSLSILIVIPLVSTPAFADFKYTDTSQITGGALMGMANLAAKFSKDSRAAMQPITTTHYVKGNKLRTDGSDGSIQIIDLDGRRVISIDNQNKTYSVATFDQIKAAMEKARADAEAKAKENPGKSGQAQDAQLQVTPKITVLPGTGTRTILSQQTNETKVKMDMEMQAQNANGQPAQPNSITFTMTMDTFVAPSVSGYREIGEFYRKMAKEINWVPPSNIHVDPRMTRGMSELQKNSDALKGLPMLSYTSMGIPPQPGSNSNSTQTASNSSSNDSSKSTDSGNPIPTSGSDAVVKGLGSLFNKRKKQQDDNAKAGTPAPPPNPNPDPNALMEMTTQVSSFSDSPLDASLFDIPAGYTQVQADPNAMLLAPAATRRR
ncbi:MAG: hypothetical protein JO260_08935 [Acidobacteria bacterium]|nr:hypothetical protein [Acidobacteriota bacterium]